MTSRGQLRRAQTLRMVITLLIFSFVLGGVSAAFYRAGELDERDRWTAASTTVERTPPQFTFKWR